MKLPGFLSKPRWLSKDAETRRNGVQHDGDSELVANLSRLAREDADAGVRIAAMKRLADPGIAQGLAHDDTDPTVRAQARALWRDLLTGTHADAPALVERLRLLKAQDDSELIEHIVRRAPEAELRRAALALSTRPATLLERALEESDPAIRLSLVERIDDEAQLARLAERARKSDKQVSRHARERIDALRIARGDGVTVEQHARLLCERLEQLIRDPGHAEAEAEIATRWEEIDSKVDEPLRLRYQAARQLLAVSRNPPAPVEPEPEAQREPSAEDLADAEQARLDAAAAAQAKADEVAANLLAQARFAASLDEARAEKQQKAERQRALLAELDAALNACDSAIDAGTSAPAHTAKARIDELRRSLDAPLPRALAQRIAATEGRYAEISQWQHWADNQRRRQLCEEIEALPAAGLHPDAVASRVREAQTEWTRLDAAEGRGNARPGGLAKRFHAACRAAFAPAEAYFKKRQELRQSHGAQVVELLSRVAALADDSADWAAMAVLRREVVEALRGLDRVEPRERKPLAQKLKDSLTALDARVARRDQEVERAKSALIAEAEALGQGAPQRGAVAAARELQQRWQGVGNGRRARDQAQWKVFRGAIDAVFKALDAERAERSARDAQARTDAEALCAQVEALGADTVPDRGALARLQTEWEALRVRDDALTNRFDEARAHVRDALAQHEQQRRTARYSAWLARYRLCRAAEHKAEAADLLRERWAATPVSDIATDQLEQRFAAALDADGIAAAEDAQPFREVLLELEFLAGIEPTEAEREQRRVLQVARLSARLRGEGTTAPEDELGALLARWSELGSTPEAELDARLDRGVAAALGTLA